MANISNKNIVSNDNVNQTNDNVLSCKTRKERTTNLQDCCNFLKQADASNRLSPGESAYDHIFEMMQHLDVNDDGILRNHKIKKIESFFCSAIKNEDMLRESMEYITNRALEDHESTMKFAMLFFSTHFQALILNGTKLSLTIVDIFEHKFYLSDKFRTGDKSKLYNYITLLGEHYCRSGCWVIGASAINLLIKELEELSYLNDGLAKLILAQVTLIGCNKHKRIEKELTILLFHLRRIIIEHANLKSTVKALLMKTLDLFYSNFTRLDNELEEMYSSYLVDDIDAENTNINAFNSLSISRIQEEGYPYEQQFVNLNSNDEELSDHNNEYDIDSVTNLNINMDNVNNVSTGSESFCGKKWSEQVLEESSMSNSDVEKTSVHQNEIVESTELLNESCSNARLSDRHTSSPRRLHYPKNCPERNYGSDRGEEQSFGNMDGRSDKKPLPRWRTTRFNRDTLAGSNYGRHQNQSRFNNKYVESDRRSEQSDNSNGFRLYSVNDRLKYVQDKSENKSVNYSVVNSNWDRQSQRDDRSERSYLSNYERGSNKKSIRHRNTHNSDKPPRFQKQRIDRNQSPPKHMEKKIHSESWRRSGSTPNHHFYNTDEHSRSKTLPRAMKNKFDNVNQNNSHISYNQKENGFSNRQRGKFANSRFGSQNSVMSDTQYNYERNYNRNTGNSKYTDLNRESDLISIHSDNENRNRLARNAKQTSKYMDYLSSQK